MQIQPNISLKKYNTFGIDVVAKYFASFNSTDALGQLLQYDDARAATQKNQIPILILGGGSNMLFTKNFDGIVLKNEIKGIEIIREDDNHVYIKAGAGENWHQFVLHCISNNLAGVENLSLIPGNVGASPMQNIGAYGVEIKDVFHSLEAFHLKEKKIVTFSLNDCTFGYRESVFKKKYKNQFVITSVTYKLNKQPVFNTSYGAIEQELEKMGVQELSIKAISDAVINIRSSKLPNPAEIGNAGSFFKNPEISGPEFHKLTQLYPSIVGYHLPNGNVKLAAGWLIEQCGPQDAVSWKGYRNGDAGCHAKQALVLVNYGHAKGDEIYALSESIIETVQQKFGVILEREVNII
ncbi:UDP-N-acetylmuramate dehydrogenase [Ferruginibacter sp. SUN106]|uniref:UDP-N-acetylmuramate dehydrogenase n=1 Tax=Ferruginibacter sp. SUN106 TaxID=2978348 RepID=UPI003D36FB7E